MAPDEYGEGVERPADAINQKRRTVLSMDKQELHDEIVSTMKILESLEEDLRDDGLDEYRQRVTEARSQLGDAALEDVMDEY